MDLRGNNLYNLMYVVICFFRSHVQVQGWEGLGYKLQHEKSSL